MASISSLRVVRLAALTWSGLAASVGAAAPADDDLARHLLARTTYGPTAVDLATLRVQGATTWLAAQLHPESIDDGDLAPRLRRYDVLNASSGDLYRRYPQEKAKAATAAAMQEMAAMDAADRRAKRMRAQPRPREILDQLAAAKLVRAAYSRRQLEEVMAEFWFNHFNVFWGKGACKWLLPSFDREAIRPHLFGRYRDLLGAVAHHPAMLFYLDNHLSTAAKPGRKGGLNENYARELMELHTLGVEGGYTQQDVIEVARCFTGWGVDHLKDAAAFAFHRGRHDAGDKMVLGATIRGDRKSPSEGEHVLDLLARHPATARFIATKLCRRFIADAPPSGAVDAVAAEFTSTDGDLRATVAAVFAQPAFTAPEFRAGKVKTPLEYMVSALRALDADTGVPQPMLRALREMGGLPYACEPPTGYPDTAAAWVNAGSLLARMRVAESLASGTAPLTRVDLERVAGCPLDGDAATITQRLWDRLVGAPMSAATRQVLNGAAGDPEIRRVALDDPGAAPDAPKLAALILGSPEFQHR